METVNIHAAKTHLSRLVDKAAAGHPFVIAKAGKPLVQVTAIPSPRPADRLGFMAGQIEVPDDFDTLGRDVIRALFGHEDDT
ncbi:MAG: type II toxin-antitoxin system Phd/YefM family antitoxin [Planctomycetia bacterium]|jgi:prevent-host-death family protein